MGQHVSVDGCATAIGLVKLGDPHMTSYQGDGRYVGMLLRVELIVQLVTIEIGRVV